MTSRPYNPAPNQLPHDLCFIRRSVSGPSVMAWDFRREADIAKVKAPRYSLYFSYDLMIWAGSKYPGQGAPFDLSVAQVELLRSLLPPDEVAFATAKSLGIGQ